MLTNIAILASEEGAENAFWLPHDIKEVIWGTLAFLIIVFLLWKFARKPIAQGLSGRIERISGELDVATQERLAAEAERDRIKAALADSDSEAARLIADARTSADRLAVEIANRTDLEVAAMRERAAADLASARSQAESDLSRELSRLSLGAAERVVQNSLDDAAQQRLIDEYISQVGSQN